MMRAALLLLTGLLPGAAAADSPVFGRLFHTPAERAELDRPHPAPDAPTATPAPPPRLDGIVLRRHGPPTIWLNGVARPPSAGMHLDHARQLSLAGAEGSPLTIRVGEFLPGVQAEPAP